VLREISIIHKTVQEKHDVCKETGDNDRHD